MIAGSVLFVDLTRFARTAAAHECSDPQPEGSTTARLGLNKTRSLLLGNHELRVNLKTFSRPPGDKKLIHMRIALH